jgi:hypothetical protein
MVRRPLRGYSGETFAGALTTVPFLPRRWLTNLRVGPRLAPPPELGPRLASLRRDGALLIPDFLSSEQVGRMRDAVPDIDAFAVSPEGDRSYFYAEADRIAALAPFFDNDTVRSFAKAYVSREAFALRRTIGLKRVKGDHLTFERFYHMDTWKPRLKAFLYLSDVGTDNAPTVYLRGSHRGYWRRHAEARIWRYYVTDSSGFAGDESRFFLGTFLPHQVEQLKRDRGYTELVCTGAAGTLLVFDGRGLHRASPLNSGERLILTSYWIHPGQHT